ncbi:HlyD family secretion protein [Oricola thermophila]|uniref:HlyD family efflux transporter periplasmic adaptor subunit n=1 Tax=Oricola thermophila TaxID=2742145 RepID=A0A6N1VJS6_9HYPH|nr:HlyD family efflux transporter periplasmic adaptor subunit [Oricola thermophila]QKV20683.1 HlyD family efflux transporter periplasmic adaptor subunit [Oricola thermophila]
MEFICALPVLAGLFGPCDAAPALAVGYVEGDYVRIAPIETAQIETVEVERGDPVEVGQVLARLESRDAQIAVAQAKAALAEAESHVSDLRLGKRPEEIAAIRASLNSARAQASEARRVLARQKDLLEQGITSQANYDTAETSLELANARVAEFEANLTVAQLPARADTIAAAEAAVAQARSALETAEWRLSKRTVASPVAGRVFDVIRSAGEIAGPQAPILTILPDGATKLRLYVPEPELARIAVGTKLTVRCDGCGPDAGATVYYIADEPEFTPPVIYSLESRQKLVYLVEALPDASARSLKPGQIVDVLVAEGK